MGLQGYVGSSEDKRRIARQEKQREEERKKFEDRKKQSDANVNAAGLRQFGAGSTEVLENAFKIETVGLVTREEFVEKRATLQDRIEEEKLRHKRESEAAAKSERDAKKARKAKVAALKAKLSFVEDDEGEEGEENEGEATALPKASTSSNGGENRVGKLGKDPTVDTDFLPDADRERQAEELRQQLKKEWELRQMAIKNEPLTITYSYWNGTGNRRQVAVRKGDTIGEFLKAVREQLQSEFRELRTTSVGNLMYIKEDLVLPHGISFYDLIINKVRGKSGPLFQFDVQDDVRLEGDARRATADSHAGKVVQRHWYDRNKHIFPASRWEVFDAERLTQQQE